MASASVKDVKFQGEFEKVIGEGSPVVVHFWAAWCDASKHMDQVFSHLATDFPYARFLRVEAEEQPEISEAYSVSAVPYFVFLKDGKQVDTLEGADPSSLANKVAKVAGSIKRDEAAAPASLGLAAGPTVLEIFRDNNASSAAVSVDDIHRNLNKRLEQLINSHPVMLFMKGSPEEPKCGFSKKVVEILKKENVKFGSFDILEDQVVREGLKKLSNWPTYPQLYWKGDLLGGSDIIVAMHESGELRDVFRDVTSTEEAEAKVKVSESESTVLSSSRLHELIHSSPVVLFMKGNPEEPKCGFSRKVVEILKQENAEFNTFDILSDEQVRQGLKLYSNWSSYPQLYINGELIGGSDMVLEMQKSGELNKLLAASVNDRLKNLINCSSVMLFMKGSPDAPRCGFSSKVVNALKEEGVVFKSFDILADDQVRQALKTYSNWPTYPQLYYNGELIGGCDIIMELKNGGVLKSTLSE